MANDEVIKLDNITEFQYGDGAKWLKKLKHELRAQHKVLSPKNILYCVDLQLAGDADRWVQQTGFVRRMLEDTAKATDEDLVRFEEAFKSRFSNIAIVGEPDVHVKLAMFQQNPKESLHEYSSRAIALLLEFGVKDQVPGVELSAPEAGTLNSIKTKFVYGLYNTELRLEAINLQALLSDSLARSITIVNTAVKMMEQKKRIMEEVEIRERLKTLDLFDKQARTAGYSNLVSYAHSLDRTGYVNSMQMRPATSTNVIPIEPSAQVVHDPFRSQQDNRRNWHDRTEFQHSIVNGSESLHPTDFICSTCGKYHYSHPQNRPCKDTSPLLPWEQSILRRLIREVRTQQSGNVHIVTGANTTPLGNRAFQRVPIQAQLNEQRPLQETSALDPPHPQNSTTRPQVNLSDYNPSVQIPNNQNSFNRQNTSFTILPNEALTVDTYSEDEKIDKESDENEQRVKFSFQANENSRKRIRIEGENNDDNLEEPEAISIPNDWVKGSNSYMPAPDFVTSGNFSDTVPKKSRAKRGTKELQEIFGRKGEGPMDYKKIINSLMIGPTLSLMDLMQISPDFTRHPVKLGTRINRRKKRQEHIDPGLNAAVTIRPVQRKPYSNSKGLVVGIAVSYNDKAFRFPAKLLVFNNKCPQGVEINLDTQHVMADQGSDTNVIANWLVDKLNFIRRPLAESIAIGTADGNTTFYKEYASISIGVGGIWCIIDALVRPHNDNGHNQAIMLGLPWLHIVNAVLDIKNSSITIGDEGIGEGRVIIETPRFTTSKFHTLTLYSTDSRYKRQLEIIERQLEELNSDKNISNDQLDTNNLKSSSLMGQGISKSSSVNRVTSTNIQRDIYPEISDSDLDQDSEEIDYSSDNTKN